MSNYHRQRVPQDNVAQMFDRMQPRTQDAARHFLLDGIMQLFEAVSAMRVKVDAMPHVRLSDIGAASAAREAYAAISAAVRDYNAMCQRAADYRRTPGLPADWSRWADHRLREAHGHIMDAQARCARVAGLPSLPPGPPSLMDTCATPARQHAPAASVQGDVLSMASMLR
ncbi:hypothetical protein [Roseomonas sp. CECT 9278]|uniref:hypothetical protein n=1 Tax=Roseomonas sp. CECT 9278 TaxID=2845823 RepID=UPI001E2FB14F|nr:hypothetical protein [Roseomonas sp. CECT 9278]CAH0161922.1 hypothetical protein ROS9278_00982 [Roseomonas sp. CECT 9278]